MIRTKKFGRKQQAGLVSQGLKGCSKCGEILSLDYFAKQKTKLGYRPYCKYCRHLHSRKKDAKQFLEKNDFWHKMKTDGIDRTHVKRIQNVFGLSFDTALELTEKLSCEICGRSREENGQRLAVDHCHSSGKIRGVLCSKCNTGLGSFDDSKEKLANAIIYLTGK